MLRVQHQSGEAAVAMVTQHRAARLRSPRVVLGREGMGGWPGREGGLDVMEPRVLVQFFSDSQW